MSPPGMFCGTPPMRSRTLPAKPPMRIFMPFKSLTDLISLRNQPPICAPVLPQGKLRNVELGVELTHELQAVAFVCPRSHLAAVQAERNRPADGKCLVLAEEVI